MSASITPFKISIPDAKLDRLKQKLLLTDFPDEVTDAESWTLGAPLADIKRLTSHWANKYSWRTAEAHLNSFPQFTTPITVPGFDAVDVHFVHQKSEVEGAIPLLFVHGWPGSFIEVTRILPELIKGGNGPAFHVVAPSLVDFGFSGASRRKDFGPNEQAEVCHALMLRLGYTEYVSQGGDLGYLITRLLAHKHPTHLKAHHISNCAPTEPTAATFPALAKKCAASPLTPSDLAGLARTQSFNDSGTAYMKIQSTRPLTIGYSLTDSPVGLLAWLYEKLQAWSDDTHDWSDDDVCTWISIYYFSRAGPAASSYIYGAVDAMTPHGFVAAGAYADVPVGVSRFPKDLLLLPSRWNGTLGPVVFEREHGGGGHFAAWERPGELVKDLREMFGRGGGAAGVVRGREGYTAVAEAAADAGGDDGADADGGADGGAGRKKRPVSVSAVTSVSKKLDAA